jgi:hypothetical protein
MSMTPDRHEIADHARVLYGYDNGGDAPGVLPIFTLPSRRTFWYQGDNLFGTTPDEIAALSVSENVYHGCCLQRAPMSGRGDAENTLVLPGCWLDLDVVGPNHKSVKLPATREIACDFLASLELEPTLVVDSGGGYQVWWCFHRLQVFGSNRDRQIAAMISTQFQARIQALAARHGWTLDSTADLARVLRVAGTINHKGDPVAVTTISRSDARYTPKELLAFARGPGAYV